MNRGQPLRLATMLAGLLAVWASPTFANHLDSASATVTCSSYTLTVSGSELNEPGVTYVVLYGIVLTPPTGPATTLVYAALLSPDTNGNATTTVTRTFPAVSGTFTLTGAALMFGTDGEVFNLVPVTFTTGTLNCPTNTGGKGFSIGPSSMEGALTIQPGDWISGGYNFKFIDAGHGATVYTVTATVTVPVTCAGGSVENIIVPLGNPGQLNGGGVTTTTFNIPAGDTSNHASNDQNSILVWEGAVQAPANLCGGVGGTNHVGATFDATVLQTPHVGLVDWQFHYRDPAAKGKPNTNCTDASDANRARADVCGASWSETFRDP
jgi:hypothetical protein